MFGEPDVRAFLRKLTAREVMEWQAWGSSENAEYAMFVKKHKGEPHDPFRR